MTERTFPYWEKGEINWRLHVAQGIFGAGVTQKLAYEKTLIVVESMNRYAGDAKVPATFEQALETNKVS